MRVRVMAEELSHRMACGAAHSRLHYRNSTPCTGK